MQLHYLTVVVPCNAGESIEDNLILIIKVALAFRRKEKVTDTLISPESGGPFHWLLASQ